MRAKSINRREFLEWAAMLTGGVVLAGCTQPTPVAPPETPTSTPAPTATPSADTVLRAGATPWAPWYFLEGNQPTGIIIDVMEAVARKTGYAIPVDVLPQNRMLEYFNTQVIDTEPVASPNWREDYADISVYSIPYCSSVDVMFVPAGSNFRPTDIQDFQGMRMGCVLGYYYDRGLQEALESEAIYRDDAPDNESNLRKLMAGRVDVIIIERAVGLYLVKELGIAPEAVEIVYEHSHADLSMRLHKNKAALLPTLDAALAELIAEGVIQTAIDKYTT